MTWYEAIERARIGIAVRRAAWTGEVARKDNRLLYIPGAGTTRAVAVIRAGGTDTVATAALVTAADLQAADWEAVS